MAINDASPLDDLNEDDEELEFHTPVAPNGSNERAIERHFETGRLRVVQDKNDFFLPHVVDFLDDRKWGNLHPEYQRRLRWDRDKKSRLIESFIMNVPVPPVFLFEGELGSYEVMDGQQRLNTIRDFLKGRFQLSNLKIWPALNGRSFETLPPLVRKGLERAKISAITLMSDIASRETDMDLRAQVFERLNTGGERLNPQELRNSLYSGSFNNLIVELAAARPFTEAWGIPSHEENILSDGSPTAQLRDNNYFKRMTDVEIVLRFYAFRNEGRIAGSVRSMLDNTMRRYRASRDSQIERLRDSFQNALSLCIEVFEDDVFRLPATRRGVGKLSRPLYDAQMVAMHNLREHRHTILRHRTSIKSAISELSEERSAAYQLMVGRANTASAIIDRIIAVRQTVEEHL